MKHKPKKIYVALVTAAIIATPVLAYADNEWWLIPTQNSNLALWAKGQSEKLYTMAKNQAEKMASLGKLQVSTLLAQDTAAEQITATTEKESAALQELTQSNMNYSAALHTARGAATAEDKFVSQASIDNMCDVSVTTEYVAQARTKSMISGKALTSTLVRRDLSLPKQNFIPTQVANTHNNNYCSEEDKQQGRCKTPAPLARQNADVQAGTLLSPSNGTTYTQVESDAAQDFIKVVTNPTRAVDLDPGLEKTAQGRAYLVAFREAVAQMSVAYNSLTQIWSARVTDDSLSEAVDASGDIELSLIGVMRKFVYDRFVDPRWKSDLAGMDINGTLREIAIVMSGKNFTTFQAFQQRQRMEALYATKLSIDSTESNEARLNDLRSKLYSAR